MTGLCLNPDAEFTVEGKRLHTLQAAVKTRASTLRKLNAAREEDPTASDAQLAATMKDNLRYTYVSDPATYNATVEAGIKGMIDRGYEPVRAVNYWQRPSGYAGLNTNWRTPAGQVFELQFHTQEGLEIKEVKSHPFYEKQRKLPEGSPEWDALQAQTDALWAPYRAAHAGLGEIPLADYFPEVK